MENQQETTQQEQLLEPTLPESLTSEQVELTQPVETAEQLIIGEELTDDDINRIYKRLGRPEAPDK